MAIGILFLNFVKECVVRRSVVEIERRKSVKIRVIELRRICKVCSGRNDKRNERHGTMQSSTLDIEFIIFDKFPFSVHKDTFNS